MAVPPGVKQKLNELVNKKPKSRKLGVRPVTKRLLEIEGIPELAKRSERLMRDCGYNDAQVAMELKYGLMKGALIIRDEARDLVPVVTGRLQSAIFAAYGNPRKVDVLVGVNTRLPVDPKHPERGNYAGIVEYGDDERPPHPYMRPAIQATRPLTARIIAEEIKAAINKLVERY